MINMNERLKEFIDLLDLSYADFANSIGVQPSSISHIVSRRNKPSVDFIEKLHHNYPDLNIDWLLFGKGHPFTQLAKEKKIPSPTLEFPNESSSEENEKAVDRVIHDIPSNENGTSDSQRLEKTIKKVIVFYTDGTFQEIV